VQQYKRLGGGYEGRRRADSSLRQWTDEEWGTASGRRSRDTGERYLPRAARTHLSEEEYRRSTAAKRRDTKAGRRRSPQPDDVARKTAHDRHNVAHGNEPTLAALREAARHRGIPGRSKMNREELRHAVGR
jgi:hypothetical protein